MTIIRRIKARSYRVQVVVGGLAFSWRGFRVCRRWVTVSCLQISWPSTIARGWDAKEAARNSDAVNSGAHPLNAQRMSLTNLWMWDASCMSHGILDTYVFIYIIIYNICICIYIYMYMGRQWKQEFKTIKSKLNCPSGAGPEPRDPKQIKSRVNSCRYILGLRSNYIWI